jgi:hypothetical protein
MLYSILGWMRGLLGHNTHNDALLYRTNVMLDSQFLIDAVHIHCTGTERSDLDLYSIVERLMSIGPSFVPPIIGSPRQRIPDRTETATKIVEEISVSDCIHENVLWELLRVFRNGIERSKEKSAWFKNTSMHGSQMNLKSDFPHCTNLRLRSRL